MTTEEKQQDIERCVREIALAEARKKEEDAYIRECRGYLAVLLGLDLENPINEKLETPEYKVSITLDPTIKVDEKKLAEMDWRAYQGIIRVKHEVSGAAWRKLPDEDKKALSSVVTVKYNTPNYKIELKEKKA